MEEKKLPGYKINEIKFDSQENFNQSLIDGLTKIIKDSSIEPTHKPTKILDQFYFYKNGTTYRLYIYINNTWKYVTLS
jgi:hypothetical protein